MEIRMETSASPGAIDVWEIGRMIDAYERTERHVTKKVYLAARYSRNAEMREVRDALALLGFEVTSRWIDCHAGKYLTSFTPEILNSDPLYCAGLGRHDLEDVDAADIVISFTGEGGKGGRHTEFGYALGRGKRLILVGPREHIFHTLPEVEYYASWRALVIALTQESGVLGDRAEVADDHAA